MTVLFFATRKISARSGSIVCSDPPKGMRSFKKTRLGEAAIKITGHRADFSSQGQQTRPGEPFSVPDEFGTEAPAIFFVFDSFFLFVFTRNAGCHLIVFFIAGKRFKRPGERSGAPTKEQFIIFLFPCETPTHRSRSRPPNCGRETTPMACPVPDLGRSCRNHLTTSNRHVVCLLFGPHMF